MSVQQLLRSARLYACNCMCIRGKGLAVTVVAVGCLRADFRWRCASDRRSTPDRFSLSSIKILNIYSATATP